MNEQEMQFADPDWKPTGPISRPTENEAVRNIPVQPVNNPRKNNNDQSANLNYEQGYRGQDQAQGQGQNQIPQPGEYFVPTPIGAQIQAYPLRTKRRRSYSWLGGLILLLVLSGAVLGVFGSPHKWTKFSPGNTQPFHQPDQPSNTYSLQGISDITINTAGNVTIQADKIATANNQLLIQTGGKSPLTAQRGTHLTINGQGPFGSDDLVIRVPEDVVVYINASGDIQADGFSGQLDAHSDSGSITLNNAHLSGQSILTTNGGNGSIDFQGTLDTPGNYLFTTDTGAINLTLPGDLAMQIKRILGNGSTFTSDIPDSNGKGSQASVTVHTNNGNVNIQKQ